MASWTAIHKKGMDLLYTKPVIIISIILSCLLVAIGVYCLIVPDVPDNRIHTIETPVLLSALFTIGVGMFNLFTKINRFKRVKAGKRWTDYVK